MSRLRGLVPTRIRFQRLCRETRSRLGWSQARLAEAIGVSRQHVTDIESGRACPTIDEVDAICRALGIDLEFGFRPPLVTPRQVDLVHARCSAHVDRRLRSAHVSVAREVEIVSGRSHGWIDLLAFDHRTSTVFIVEIKTQATDLGAIERQLAWYERMATDASRRLGWWPRFTATWLLLLASDETDAFVRANRDVLARAFPRRAPEMLESLRAGDARTIAGRGLALIDPATHRRDWLIRSSIDGRRSTLPYRGYADAAAWASRR